MVYWKFRPSILWNVDPDLTNVNPSRENLIRYSDTLRVRCASSVSLPRSTSGTTWGSVIRRSWNSITPISLLNPLSTVVLLSSIHQTRWTSTSNEHGRPKQERIWMYVVKTKYYLKKTRVNGYRNTHTGLRRVLPRDQWTSELRGTSLWHGDRLGSCPVLSSMKTLRNINRGHQPLQERGSSRISLCKTNRSTSNGLQGVS